MIVELSSPITADERDLLVNCLLACDSSKEFWDQIISELPREIKTDFGEMAVQRMRVSNLLRRCLAVPNGMEFLLNRLRANTSRSLAWSELARPAFFLLARFPESSQDLAEQLVDLIEAIDPSPTLLRKLQRNLSNGLAFTPISGYQLVLRLFQLADKAAGIRFIRLLARDVEDPAQRESLRQWSEEAANVFSIQPDALPSTTALKQSGSFLLVQLQPVTPDNEQFRLFSWLDADGGMRFFSDGEGRVFKLAEAAEEIGLLARTVLSTIGNDLEIELIVKRGVFCHDVTAWEVEIDSLKRALIRDTPLVLRCFERVEARRTELARGKQGLSAAQAALAALREKQEGRSLVNLAGWRDKCAALEARTDHEVETLLHPIAEAVPDLNKLLDEWRPGDKGLCVGLGFVPATAVVSSDELSTAIAGGVPIIFWFRDLPGGKALDEPKLKQLFSPSKVKLAELRRHLWQLRREAVINNASDDYCRHITLLYDDYNRVPPPPPNEAPAPKTP